MWIRQVELGLGDGLGDVLDDPGLLGDDDGADDDVLGCELVELAGGELELGGGVDPLPVPGAGVPVFVGTGFFPPTAVGAPGFAGVPVCLTGGSLPVNCPIGMPLIGTPRR
jgi:hypothetical protein